MNLIVHSPKIREALSYVERNLQVSYSNSITGGSNIVVVRGVNYTQPNNYLMLRWQSMIMMSSEVSAKDCGADTLANLLSWEMLWLRLFLSLFAYVQIIITQKFHCVHVIA